MLRLGWFSTARGQTSGKLLTAVQERIQSGELDARIEVVFCNRERGEDANTDKFLDLVRSYGLPLICLSYRNFRHERGLPPAPSEGPLPPWRREYDAEIIRLLAPYDFDLVMLAGYMLVASDLLCQRYDMLNLHPAAPGGPKGMWQEVIWQLIAARASHSGVSIHLATPELDAGPTVTYCLYPIRGPEFDQLWQQLEQRTLEEIKASEGETNPLFQKIRQQGVTRELPMVGETLRSFAEGALKISGKQVHDRQGCPISGLDLTAQIEGMVARSGV
ncbi:MAG TPA: formyltransferase family protein [Dehalococcoidia bacterium]|nr:formyltransferase family protein [Dehalococcoidia bacterium]